MADSFSSALRIGGLDDYLNPEQECVLPLLQQQPAKQSKNREPAAANAAEASGSVATRLRPARAAVRRRADQPTEAAKQTTNPVAPSDSVNASESPQGEPELATAALEATTSEPAPAAAAAFPPPSSAEAQKAPPDGGVSRVGKISLSDCLSCSGCLTSAEGILLSQQSADEFFSLLSRKQRPTSYTPPQQQRQEQMQGLNAPKVIAVSLSSQCIAAVSLHFGCSPTVAAGRLSFLFRLLGADFVFSMAAAEALALLETHKEFVGRLQEHLKVVNELEKQLKHSVSGGCSGVPTAGEAVAETLLRSSGPLPLITSYCPGLVLYAEKSLEAPLLSFLSRIRSAQQIQGLFCKSAVRGSVEAVAFQLALKFHAWPGNFAATATAARTGQSVCGMSLIRKQNAPWKLFQLLLRRSPYACYAAEEAADNADAGFCNGPLAMAASGHPNEPETAVGSPSTDAASAGTATAAATGAAAAATDTGAGTGTAAADTAATATIERQRGGLLPEEVLHVCVMPCFDKKLEAARPDFGHAQNQHQKEQLLDATGRGPSSFIASPVAFGVSQAPWAEVDMVLATSELPLLLQKANTAFDSLPSAPLDCLVPGTALRLVARSLRAAAAKNTGKVAVGEIALFRHSDSQAAKTPCDADDAVSNASACAAEEAAVQTEAAAKSLPPFSHSHENETVQCTGGVAGIARPTAVLAGSGGYLEYLFLQTACGIFKRDLSPENLHFVRGPNEELQSLSLLPHSRANAAKAPPEGETEGPFRVRRRGLWNDRTPALLRGAFAYGFRNIQNVIQQLRLLLPPDNQEMQANGSDSSSSIIANGGVGFYHALGIKGVGSAIPHIVEVGACPGGCLNGGGQSIKIEPVTCQHSLPSSCSASKAIAGCCQEVVGSADSSKGAYEPKIIGKHREPLRSLTRLFHAEFPLIAPETHPLVLPAYMFLFGCCYGEETGPAAGAALGEFELLLQQREATEVLQHLFCGARFASLPLRFWLSPRVTAVFRMELRATKTAGKNSAAVSLSDLKW